MKEQLYPMDDMPMSDAGYTGGDYGKSISMADLKRGFTKETLPDEYVDLNGENRAGDPGSMPMRGTRTGCDNDNGDYGADVSQDATNSMGGISRATRSDPMDQRFSKDQQGL